MRWCLVRTADSSNLREDDAGGDGMKVTFQVGDAALAHPLADQRILAAFSDATRAAMLQWEADATKRTPVGVSGNLRSGYSTRMEVTMPLAIIGSLRNAVFYFPHVEEGARAHWPPYGPGSDLARWAERKLGDAGLAYVVARSIARGTTRGTAIRGVHMARKSLRTLTPHIRALWRDAWALVTRELSQ